MNFKITPFASEYEDLFQIWEYSQWKECVTQKQKRALGNDVIIIQIFKDILSREPNTVSSITKQHAYTYLNEQLIDSKFFAMHACRIAEIASINFKHSIPHLKSCNIDFRLVQGEISDIHVEASSIPLIHESPYFRELCTGRFNESGKRSITLHNIDGKIFLNICRFLETNESEYIFEIKEDAFTIFEYLDMWGMSGVFTRVNNILKIDSSLLEMLHKEWSFELYIQSLNFFRIAEGRFPSFFQELVKSFKKNNIKNLSSLEICTLISTIAALNNEVSLKKKCISFILDNFDEINKKIKQENYEEIFQKCLLQMRGWRSKIIFDGFKGKLLPSAMLLMDKSQREIKIKISLQKQDFQEIVWPQYLNELSIDDGSCFGDEELDLLLKQCPELESIHIKKAAITNLGLFKGVKKLKVLKLPGVICKGLDTLPCNDTIETVDFSSVHFEDLSPLKRLSKLKVIILKESLEIDLSFLPLVKEFELLDISRSKNEITLSERGITRFENKGVIKMEGIHVKERKKKELLEMFPNCTFYYK